MPLVHEHKGHVYKFVGAAPPPVERPDVALKGKAGTARLFAVAG